MKIYYKDNRAYVIMRKVHDIEYSMCTIASAINEALAQKQRDRDAADYLEIVKCEKMKSFHYDSIVECWLFTLEPSPLIAVGKIVEVNERLWDAYCLMKDKLNLSRELL